MLVRESIVNGGVVALNNEPGEMISHNILSSRIVFDLQVKLLEQQNRPDEARLSILLLEEVLNAEWSVYTMTLEHRR